MNTVRLPERLRERVHEVARRKGVSVSEVHRLALEQLCDRELAEPAVSRWDDLIGIWDGPEGDFAARASELFAEGMERKHGRHAR